MKRHLQALIVTLNVVYVELYWHLDNEEADSRKQQMVTASFQVASSMEYWRRSTLRAVMLLKMTLSFYTFLTIRLICQNL